MQQAGKKLMTQAEKQYMCRKQLCWTKIAGMQESMKSKSKVGRLTTKILSSSINYIYI